MIDSYMRPIVKYLPCIILDTEGDYITIGLLNSIERIDHIDYRFFYEWKVLIYNGNIEFRNKPNEGTESYNHLESMKTEKDQETRRRMIEYVFI